MDYPESLNELERKKVITPQQREALSRTLSVSAGDPFGDGDQSPIPDPSHPDAVARLFRSLEEAAHSNMEASVPLRSARDTGLDWLKILEWNMDDRDQGRSYFHFNCFIGCVEPVRRGIAEARDRVRDGDSTALTRLLELRLTLLRFSPLHFCCFGATVHERARMKEFFAKIRYEVGNFQAVARQLCAAGARVDPRDIVGYTPLGLAAGSSATDASRALVPVLVSNGADPNMKTRFGEPLLMDAFYSENPATFIAMVEAGADVDAEDNVGISTFNKVKSSQVLCRAWVEFRRRQALDREECDACGKKGASKYCSSCRKTFYCSRTCQARGWKNGHKELCGKIESPEDWLDIDVDTMTCDLPADPTRVGPLEFRTLSGGTTKKMKPKEFEVAFVVGVYVYEGPLQPPIVLLIAPSGGYLRIKASGGGRATHMRLLRLVASLPDERDTCHFVAKWLQPPNGSSSKRKKRGHVLRLDLSKLLPPPKPQL